MGDDKSTDMKAALKSLTKVPLAILPRPALNYLARALQWGDARYARGNYRRSPPEGVTPEQRLLTYLDATMRHLTDVSDALNKALGRGESILPAIQKADADSGLPELAHALASLSLAITCAVDDGLLSADPGPPPALQRVQRYESSQLPLPPPVGVRVPETPATGRLDRNTLPGVGPMLRPAEGECFYAETRYGIVCGRCSIPLDPLAKGGGWRCRISGADIQTPAKMQPPNGSH